MGKKIATCCYCGTRAVLVLDESRHELVCSACGAPLHDMKFMPQPTEKAQKKPKPVPRSDHGARGADFGGSRPATWFGKAPGKVSGKAKKANKKRKKKPVFRRFLEEIFDEIEDIFD